MTSCDNLNNRHGRSDEISGLESDTQASLDNILQNMNDLIISLNSLNVNIEKRERPRSVRQHSPKWKYSGWESGGVNKNNVIAGTPETDDFNSQSRPGNVITDNGLITKPDNFNNVGLLQSKKSGRVSVTNHQHRKLMQTDKTRICNHAGNAPPCHHHSLPNHEIGDNNANSSQSTAALRDNTAQTLHKIEENQYQFRKEIPNETDIKLGGAIEKRSQSNGSNERSLNDSSTAGIVSQSSAEELSNTNHTKIGEKQEEHVGILRSSPTIRRKDRPIIKPRIISKQRSESTESEIIPSQTNLKTLESKIALKDEPSRIRLRSHRSLSIRNVFNRKFGSLRIDKSKLKSSLSAPADSISSSIRKASTTAERHDINAKNASILSCFQQSEQYSSSEEQENIKFQTLPKKPSSSKQGTSFNRRTMSLDDTQNNQKSFVEKSGIYSQGTSFNKFPTMTKVSYENARDNPSMATHPALINKEWWPGKTSDRSTLQMCRQASTITCNNNPGTLDNAMKRAGSVPGNIFLANVDLDSRKFSLARYKAFNKPEANCSSIDSNRKNDSSIQRRSTIGSSDVRDDKFRILGRKKKRADQNRSSHRHSAHIVFKGNNGTIEEYQNPRTNVYAEDYPDVLTNKQSNIRNKSQFAKPNKSAELQKLNSESDQMERTWQSQGNNFWGNMNGNRVELEKTDLLSLSESECDTLQKIALQHLAGLDLGVTVSIPKDDSKALNRKSSMKRKYAMLAIGAKSKGKKEDHVFGIPLVRVVENDQLLRLQTGAESDEALYNTELNPQGYTSLSLERDAQNQDDSTKTEKSSSIEEFPSSSSLETATISRGSPSENNSQNTSQSNTPVLSRKSPTSAAVSRPLKRRDAIGADTTSEINPDQSKLLESLMLSVSSTRMKKRSLLPPTMPQVPYVVQKCCTHIIKYGLHVTGIFRVAGSKKRVRQLREEFDRGVDVKIDEDYNSHDVATLLKEFFRDLPEAIMTKELYQAFLSTLKLDQTACILALRCLVWLLPIPNRDTLQTLIHFLAAVSVHSKDYVDANGNEVSGNKMGVVNLATIFGPNILHRNKKTNASNSDAQYQVQSLERAEESVSVIKVIQNIIENEEQLFQIPNNIHDEIFQILRSTDPDAVDFLLRRKAANCERNRSRGEMKEGLMDEDKSQDVNDETFHRHLNNNNMKDTNAKEDIVQENNEEENPSQFDADQAADVSHENHDPPLSPDRIGRSVSFTDADIRDILLTSCASRLPVFTSEGSEDDENSDIDTHSKHTPEPELDNPQTVPADASRSRRQALIFTASTGEFKNSEISSKTENFDYIRNIHAAPLVGGNQTNCLYRVTSQPNIYYERTNTQQNSDGNNNKTNSNNGEDERSLDYPHQSKDKEHKMRKRLPSTLNLRVHHVYSKNTNMSHVPYMHGMASADFAAFHNSSSPSMSNDIHPRFTPGKQNLKNSNSHHKGRRVSKDDMYMVLQRFVEVREEKLRKCGAENRGQRSQISHRTLGTLV